MWSGLLPGNWQKATRGCGVQRGPTFMVPPVDVSPMFHQKFHHVQVVVNTCLRKKKENCNDEGTAEGLWVWKADLVQGSQTVHIGSVYVSSLTDEPEDFFFVASSAGREENTAVRELDPSRDDTGRGRFLVGLRFFPSPELFSSFEQSRVGSRLHVVCLFFHQLAGGRIKATRKATVLRFLLSKEAIATRREKNRS